MKLFLIVIARLLLSIIGAVAGYFAIYWLTGWLSHNLGYESSMGKVAAFVDGAISPLAFGIIVVLVLAALFFWLLPKAVPKLRRTS